MPETKIDAAWLKRMRERHGLSQKALTRLLGTGERTAGMWEAGFHRIQPMEARRLQRVDSALSAQARDFDPCTWVGDYASEFGDVPTVLELADHLDTCAACMSRAYAGVVVPRLAGKEESCA